MWCQQKAICGNKLQLLCTTPHADARVNHSEPNPRGPHPPMKSGYLDRSGLYWNALTTGTARTCRRRRQRLLVPLWHPWRETPCAFPSPVQSSLKGRWMPARVWRRHSSTACARSRPPLPCLHAHAETPRAARPVINVGADCIWVKVFV